MSISNAAEKIISDAENFVREHYSIKGNVPSELVYRVADIESRVLLAIAFASNEYANRIKAV